MTPEEINDEIIGMLEPCIDYLYETVQQGDRVQDTYEAVIGIVPDTFEIELTDIAEEDLPKVVYKNPHTFHGTFFCDWEANLVECYKLDGVQYAQYKVEG